jgi:hypothetical protein
MAIAINHLHAVRPVPRVVGYSCRTSTVREEIDPTPLGIARRPVAVREPVLAFVPAAMASHRRSAEVYEARRAIAMAVAVAAVVLAGIIGFVRGGDVLPSQQSNTVPAAQVELP